MIMVDERKDGQMLILAEDPTDLPRKEHIRECGEPSSNYETRSEKPGPVLHSLRLATVSPLARS